MTKRSPVQALYELCKKTFTSSSSGRVAPPDAIHSISLLLDNIRPSDVGLNDGGEIDDRGYGSFGTFFFRDRQATRTARWSQPITYLHIYECSTFSIGIFCFPSSSVIPLHDHPGMTVLSKILYGSMHVKAYDWVEPPCIQKARDPDDFHVRLAKLHADTVLTAPCPPSILYPKSGGNLHCFTAVTPCAILDVIAPPYSEAAGRFCTYYNDYPYASFAKPVETENLEDLDEYSWLEELEAPNGFYTQPGMYAGPSIVV